MTQPLDINKLANTLARETIAGIQSAMSEITAEKDAEIARHKAALKMATDALQGIANNNITGSATAACALLRITEEWKP